MRNGFSLIELMIALTIIAILAMVVYPAYTHYLIRARRSDGKIALQLASAKLERYYLQYHHYDGATLDLLTKSPHGWYRLSLQTDNHHYLIQAIPHGTQSTDHACESFSLNQSGDKQASGTASTERCWA